MDNQETRVFGEPELDDETPEDQNIEEDCDDDDDDEEEKDSDEEEEW